MALLGIDLGTSSVKVMLLDTQGQVLSESKAGYAVLAPQAGWSESEPDAWWSATVTAVQAALARAPQTRVTALGLSGQMHGLVLSDAQGHALRPALLWADTRAEEELEHYRRLPASLRASLANPLVPGMAGPMLCWLARHEQPVYQQARWAFQPKDWLRFQLTGVAATDHSDASGTLLYDLLAATWADDVVAALRIHRHLLAPLRPSGAIAGRLTRRAAEILGLPEDIPVATGAADTAAAALGTGLLTPGQTQLTLGTGAQLLKLCAKPDIDQTARTHLYRAAGGTSWYAMAAVQNAGLAFDWVRRLLQADWSDLYASAASIPPGSEGLLFLPSLTRERPHYPVPASHGAFLGMRIDHQRAHLLHATLEGVAFGIRIAWEALPSHDQESTLRLAGGGSEHPAWRQMLADILNQQLFAVDIQAASVRGAALLAGLAEGLWPDAQGTAVIAPRLSLIATPEPARVARYNELYRGYLESIGHLGFLG